MKNVLITGAQGGMGRAVTDYLKDKGYRVFALDLSVEKSADGVTPVTADVTSEESLQEAFAYVRSFTEHLDAILHFAGIYKLDSLVEVDDETFKSIVDVNLRGAFLVNKIFLPLLRRDSRILITTSELAPLDPLPFTGLYAVTKSALDKYAYSLRMELQLLGIKVSVLRAGAVETDMLGVSTRALDRFCKNTQLYTCNAVRFQKIVNSVEARSVSPMRIARKSEKILQKRNPRFVYTVNRNPLLLLLNLLPRRIQFWVIRRILS